MFLCSCNYKLFKPDNTKWALGMFTAPHLHSLTSPPHLHHITLPPHLTPASSVWRLFCTPIALPNRMLPGPGPKYALQRATSLLSEELTLCKYMATLLTSEGHLQLRLRALHTTMASGWFRSLQHTCTVPSEGLVRFNKLFGPSVQTEIADFVVYNLCIHCMNSTVILNCDHTNNIGITQVPHQSITTHYPQTSK